MTLPYQDRALSIEERVNDLMSRMSLADKAGQLTQYFYMASFGGETSLPDDFDIESLPEEIRDFAKQPIAVEQALANGAVGSMLFVTDSAQLNRLQKMTIDGNPHGIPAIFGFDVIHGFRTILPVPIAMAASWCPDTIETGQAMAAREARATGLHWTFAPMVDIARDPRWGRIIEGAGEDPYLGGRVAAAQVRGFQGPEIGTEERIIAGPKHFAGYGAARGGRDYDDSDISDAELWNVYLPPFKAAIDAGAGNIMSAYMDLNGVPASGNKWLLDDVLRGEFGFEGFVVSDANGVRSLATQHFAKDLADAGARGLVAGNDMEMAMFDPAFAHLTEAVEQGLISEEAIDTSVRRILGIKFRLGIFENPYADEEHAEAVLSDPAHRDVARAAAEKTSVLLKNENKTLPLKADELKSIAVLGSLADSKRDILGPWIFVHKTEEAVSVLEGMRNHVGDKVTVEYTPGVRQGERLYPSMFDRMDGTDNSAPEGWDDEAELQKAVDLASNSDVAVIVIGQPQNMIGEAASVSHLDLPPGQLELLKRVHATGTPVVALVMNGRPLDLRWADENIAAILDIWYPGTQGGTAVAKTLFGDVSPGGKLPFTWPRHVGHVPMVYSHYRTFQPENQDKRYWDEPSTPLYPFGHGLSYASFEYSNLSVSSESIAIGESVTVSVDVTNTGDVAADEVAQLYIHQRYGSHTRPIRELKGFERVALNPGETTTLTFELGPDQLRYWGASARSFVQDATEYDVWVGGNSTAELATTFAVTA